MAIYSWFTHWKWWCSIVILVYQKETGVVPLLITQFSSCVAWSPWSPRTDLHWEGEKLSRRMGFHYLGLFGGKLGLGTLRVFGLFRAVGPRPSNFHSFSCFFNGFTGFTHDYLAGSFTVPQLYKNHCFFLAKCWFWLQKMHHRCLSIFCWQCDSAIQVGHNNQSLKAILINSPRSGRSETEASFNRMRRLKILMMFSIGHHKARMWSWIWKCLHILPIKFNSENVRRKNGKQKNVGVSIYISTLPSTWKPRMKKEHMHQRMNIIRTHILGPPHHHLPPLAWDVTAPPHPTPNPTFVGR